MKLIFLSAFILFVNVMLLKFPLGCLVDLISPVLTLVALTRRNKTIIWWIVVMGFLWSPFIGINVFNLMVAWALIAFLVKFFSRGIEWQNNNTAAIIAIIVSFSWQILAVAFEFIALGIVSDEIFFWQLILIRSLSCGIIVIIFKKVVFLSNFSPHTVA